MWLGAIEQSIFTQKLNINIAVRIQLAPAVSAQRDDGEGRHFLELAQGRKLNGGPQQMLKHGIDYRRSSHTYFATQTTAAMQFFQPGRFVLEKPFVPRQFTGRSLAFRQNQLLLCARLYFLNKFCHRAWLTQNRPGLKPNKPGLPLPCLSPSVRGASGCLHYRRSNDPLVRHFAGHRVHGGPLDRRSPRHAHWYQPGGPIQSRDLDICRRCRWRKDTLRH